MTGCKRCADMANFVASGGLCLRCSEYEKAVADRDQARAERDAARDALRNLKELVEIQANDEGLWATPWNRQITAGEAYVQDGLRKLHAAIEHYADAALAQAKGEDE